MGDEWHRSEEQTKGRLMWPIDVLHFVLDGVFVFNLKKLQNVLQIQECISLNY